jgi:hypothetical protein
MKAIHFVRVGLVALGMASASCSAVRQGTGTSYLIVNSLQARSFGELGGILHSDVLTGGGVINDNGVVEFSLGLKDPGAPNQPTPNQFITVDRYRVKYIRADGRNVEGVDVPYGFDGGLTATVTSAGGGAAFLLVRHTAKRESPLAALANDFQKILTIAEVTFYGHDQTGHEVSAVGRITIDFGNFADEN